jgi:hypothetical protein
MAGVVHPHSQLVADILLAVGSHPQIRLWKTSATVLRTGNRFYRSLPTGHADIIGIMVGGYFIAIEVKTGKAVLSLPQKKFAERIVRFGGCHVVARCVEDVVGGILSFRADRGLDPLEYA